MFIPMPALIALCVLAGLFLLLVALVVHVAARDAGLTFIGRRDLFLKDGVLLTRWCLLYVPIHTSRGYHSTLLLD